MMPTIAIVTDSDSSIPREISEKYGIQVVPITIHFADQSYTTGIDIDDAQLFKKIDQLNKLPTTAAPSPNAFAHAYQEAFRRGASTVVCICVSSKISATYSSAVSACEMFPGHDIEVIDSLLLSMGQGFMALAAAKAAQAGASKSEVIAAAKDVGQRAHVMGILSTLKYLAMGGRMSKFKAGMADTLNVKPILAMKDGKLDLLERVRTVKKAQGRLLDVISQTVGEKTIEQMAMIHVNNLEGARVLQESLRARMPLPEDNLTVEFTAGLSVHTGSGMAGIVFITSR